MSTAGRASTKAPTPLKYLKSAQSQVVLVKLKDGNEYVGVLELVDPTMNIVLSDCDEIDSNGNKTTKYGKALIRGSQILFVSINYGRVSPELALR
ncbi:MAG: U6 snRNA-associated Sm-like protein LSm6 [Desulfurococcaceae archaeon]|nr:U6 snRNA-associated Sm-like protein LSm6 [Sulfolobales archaeon]MDW8170694.1 U6 snRNA-associated Sm-like protein LSm6 [Desulfurococcaceae archaeon]